MDAPPADTVETIELREPLSRDWPAQWVSFEAEGLAPEEARGLGLFAPDGSALESCVAVVEDPDGTTRTVFYCYTDLAADETKILHVRERTDPGPVYFATEEADGRLVIASDLVEIAVPAGTRAVTESAPAPILSVRRRNGAWLGQGAMRGFPALRDFRTEIDRSDPHALRYRVHYGFEGGGTYAVTLTMVAHEPSVLVEETFLEVAAGEFVFDLQAGLDPINAHWRTHRTTESKSGQLGRTNHYRIGYDQDEVIHLQPFYSWWTDYAVWWAGYQPKGDYLGLYTTQPSRWTNPPPNVIRIEHGPPRRVEAVLPLREGTRTWGMLLVPETQAGIGPDVAQPRVYEQIIRHTENSLDRVKDLILEVPAAREAEYPHLLCGPEDVPGIQEKARAHPLFKRVLEEHPEKPGDPAGLYLATGEEKHARKAIDRIKGQLEEWVEEWTAGDGYNGGAMVCIGQTRPMRSLALAFDLVAGSESITPEEKEWILRAFAFSVYSRMDENQWPARDQGFSRGNVNFHSDHYTAVAAVACLLADHPRQQEWMEYVERELDYEFETSVWPGGAWVEAPNYQGFTLHYLLIAIRAMQRNGFKDYARYGPLRDTMRFLFHLQTPYDERVGRHLLPSIGDTTTGYHSQSLAAAFAWMATLAVEDDPDFAGLMMHAWERAGRVTWGGHGSGIGSGWTQPLTLVNPDIPARPPEEAPKSEWFRGYGTIFRNNYGSDEESYFFTKTGQIAQHFDADDGSFHWFARGKPMSLDFGCMYQPSNYQSWLHSTLAIDHRVVWTRGEVTSFITLPGADYVASELAANDLQRVSEVPEDGWQEEIERAIAFVYWKRQVLFVKGADYIVLRDDTEDIEGQLGSDWSVQVMADAAEVQGQKARFTGQFGMDLLAQFVEPAEAALWTTEWGYEGMEAADWVEDPPPGRIGETQIALHAKAGPGGSYLALLFPFRREGETAPVIRDRQPGAVSFDHNNGTDTVFFAKSNGAHRLGEIMFAGRVGVFRREGERLTAQIIEGISFQCREGIFQIPGPATVVIEPGYVRVESRGFFRSAFCHWLPAPPLPAVLTVDGEEKPVYATFDGYFQFEMTEGAHVYEVRWPGVGKQQ